MKVAYSASKIGETGDVPYVHKRATKQLVTCGSCYYYYSTSYKQLKVYTTRNENMFCVNISVAGCAFKGKIAKEEKTFDGMKNEAFERIKSFHV